MARVLRLCGLHHIPQSGHGSYPYIATTNNYYKHKNTIMTKTDTLLLEDILEEYRPPDDLEMPQLIHICGCPAETTSMSDEEVFELIHNECKRCALQRITLTNKEKYETRI